MINGFVVVLLVVSLFVGFNIGGSSTGVAFGPAVGSNVIKKGTAAVLMSVFVVVGGATIGREVIETIGKGVVQSGSFTLGAAAVVLGFTGTALLLSNLFGVPASTSMTTVGATAGMGIAGGFLQWRTMGEILIWWLITPVIAFWVSAVVGRYLYPTIHSVINTDRSESPLLEWRQIGRVSFPLGVGEETTSRELVTTAMIAVIACYMAFTAGASNIANAVGPLFGAGVLGTGFGPYVALGGGGIAIGAFSIARRTLDTVGNELTDLPLAATLTVELVGGSLVTFLSTIGIPASLAVSTTMSIIGLGWGRASRTVSAGDAVTMAVEYDAGQSQNENVESIDLFDQRATARVIALWFAGPSIAGLGSYFIFVLFPLYG